MKAWKLWMALTATVLAVGCAQIPNNTDGTIVLQDQGSFAIGGSTVTHDGIFSREHFLAPDGQTAYGDHAYVFYQIPVNAKAYPLIFQHGGAQSKRTWESTPDGRDGFANIFLKAGYSVYLIDQPRTGEAGLSTVPEDNHPFSANPMYADKAYHELCRLGIFPKLFEGSAFPKGDAALEAFQRSWTPYNGPLDNDVNAAALGALFDKVGDGVLITHSMGGTIGWRTPFVTDHIKAIVALEPGGAPFIFPKGEMPKALPCIYPVLGATAVEVPLESFMKLTQIPIVMIYGDNIYKSNSAVGPDKWQTELDMAYKFADCINRHGGQAEVIHLPDIGIVGNSHFLMSETNNQEIAQVISNWLNEHGL